MFKKLLLFTSCLTLLSPAMVLAANDGDSHYGLDDTFKAINTDYSGGDKKNSDILPESIAGGNDIPTIVGKIVAVGLSLIGIVFFLLALYAGFIWMTAMGNTEQVTKAKDILEAAAIGLVIVTAAYAITTFVFTSLVGETTPGPATTVTTVTCVDCQATCIIQSCPHDCKVAEVKNNNIDQVCTECITKNFKTIRPCQEKCTPEVSQCTR